jgi:hypothetical protein
LEKIEEVYCWQHVALGKNLKMIIYRLSLFKKEAPKHEISYVVGEDSLLIVLIGLLTHPFLEQIDQLSSLQGFESYFYRYVFVLKEVAQRLSGPSVESELSSN